MSAPGSASSSQPAAPLVAASYERKSDADALGIADQYVINTQKAGEEGHAIPDAPAFRFSDDDTPGASTHRANFERLVAVVESGQAPFTRVYVKDHTRFGRWEDPRTRSFYEVHFERLGVLVRYAANEETAREQRQRGVDAAPESSAVRTGRFLKDAFDSVDSSEERGKLIRRVRGGMRGRVKRGFYPGSSAPFGMERWLADKFTGDLLNRVPDQGSLRLDGQPYKLKWAGDDSPAVVRSIFEAYDRGESMADIARDLNAAGVSSPGSRKSRKRKLGSDARRTPGAESDGGHPDAAASLRGAQSGPKWYGDTVARILENRIYCGDLVWAGWEKDARRKEARRHTSRQAVADKEAARVDGTEPILFRDFAPGAPVSRELFERAAARRRLALESAAGQRASRPETLLTALLQCASCAAPVYGHNTPRGYSKRPRMYRHSQPRQGRGRTDPARLSCPHRHRYMLARHVEQGVLACVRELLADGKLAEVAAREAERLLGADQTARRADALLGARHDLAEKKEAHVRLEIERAGVVDPEVREAKTRAGESLAEEVRRAKARVDHLDAEVAQLERVRADASRQAERLADLRASFATAIPKDRKRAVRMLLQHATLDFENRTLDVTVRAIPTDSGGR